MPPSKCYAWDYVEKVGDFCACLLCDKIYSAKTGVFGIIPHLEHHHGLFAEVHAHPGQVAEILRQHYIDDLDKRRKEVRKQLRAGNVPTRPSATVVSKGNRQRASYVWHYAERVGGIAHCLVCGKQSRANGATSTLSFHLESHHGITKALHFEQPERVVEMLKKQGVSDLEERRRSFRGQGVKHHAEPKSIAGPVKKELMNTSASSRSSGLWTDSEDDSDVEIVGTGKRLQKKSKATRSFVWAYFAKFDNSKECLICGARLAAVSPTSGEYHLRDRHDITRQRHEQNPADILRHLKENGIDVEANRRAAIEAEKIRLQRSGVVPPPYRPPTPPDSPKKKGEKKQRKKRARPTAYWRYDDDDDSTPIAEKETDAVPPKQKRGRPRKPERVEKNVGHVEVGFAVPPPVATVSQNTEIARLETEIEEGKKRLKQLQAELIALEFEEASFMNGGQVAARISATKQTDIRRYCEVIRRENVASAEKEVELIAPTTRQATIGEFFKTI